MSDLIPAVTSVQDVVSAALVPTLDKVLDSLVAKVSTDPVVVADLNQFVSLGVKIGLELLAPLASKAVVALAAKFGVKAV